MDQPEIIKSENTPFIIYKYHTLDSTNAFLKLHQGNLPDYSAIWAEEQTRGIGRFERSWSSIPQKDLTFSLLLPADTIPVTVLPTITQVAALSIAQQVELLGLTPEIKWPNDVLLNKKKFCGIVCELVENRQRPLVILGIGVNINSAQTDLAAIDQPATSLFCECGKTIDRNSFFLSFLLSFYSAYQLFIQNGFSPFIDAIRQRLTLLGTTVTFISGNSTYRGKMLDLNPDGAIAFQTVKGEIVHFISGEVSVRKSKD
jgi:BirA family biotin operon repressor/biotin-[acetyl-CoA-carboxylase] ligase